MLQLTVHDTQRRASADPSGTFAAKMSFQLVGKIWPKTEEGNILQSIVRFSPALSDTSSPTVIGLVITQVDHIGSACS